MKKSLTRSNASRLVAYVLVATAVVLSVLLACRHTTTPVSHSVDTHYLQQDSLLQGIEDADSLAAMVKRYHEGGDRTGEMLALKYLGLCLRKQSQYAEALDVHNRGLQLATLAADTIETIDALNNIGTDYRRLCDLSKAASYHYRALKLCDIFSDKTSPHALKSRNTTLFGIGNIEFELCNYSAADSLFRQALQGETELDNPLGMSANCSRLGAVMHAMGEADSAWMYYRKAQELFKMMGSKEGEAMCHLHFGELFEDERSFSHAREEYKMAYDGLKELGESFYWLEACLPLANVCILLGEQDDAKRYLQEAEEEARRINNKEMMAQAYEIHYELSLLEGNAHEALNYYVNSQELEDSVFGLEKSEEMRRQRIDYERESKLGEVDTLNQEIVDLKRVRDMMGVFGLLLTLMAGAIIATLIYAMRMRSRTQRVLRQIEETRSLFFTNVVHQLRTPLTAIMGATDNIVATDAAVDIDEQRKNVEIIERQGKNLLVLVDRILQVGGVRSALHEPEWRTGDAVVYVRMVVESYRERCMERHIELTYTSCEPSVTIDTVPPYLKAILGSYIENAINYSKDFSKISVISFVDKNQFVVEVSDSGIGISEGDLPHVFDPFFRGALAEHMVDGVGIGLTVARDMTMAMGGEVSVTSVKDQGSCFTVRLPLKHGKGVKERIEYFIEPVARLATRRRQESESPITPDAGVDGSLPLMLVVEDHADVAHLVGRVFDGYYGVIYATDGEQALDKMRQHRPDVVITDVKMPKMDGLELCRQMRASSDLRGIPIILISARTSDADRVRGIEAGADAYMVKPFVPEELRAWVKRLMDSRRMQMDDCLRSCQRPDIEEPLRDAEPCDGGDYIEDADMFLDKFKQEVEKQMAVGFKLDYDKLALSLKMGESKMRRRVQQLTGKSLSSYIIQLRMERAMHLLKARPDLRIGDVAEMCGFVDVAYFSRVFRQHYGMTPTEARNSTAD